MKYLKMLGLAAVAALALAAVVGASTASAAALCKTAPSKSGVCEGGKYASGTKFNATSEKAELVVTGGAVSGVTCTHSAVALKNTAETGATGVPGEITDVTFSSCKVTGSETTCTATTTSGYTGTLTPTTDTGNGTLNVKGAAVTTVTCGGIFRCEYKAPEAGLNLALTGGNPAQVTATSVTLTNVGGFGCGTAAHWSATYTLKAVEGSPTALWVSTS